MNYSEIVYSKTFDTEEELAGAHYQWSRCSDSSGCLKYTVRAYKEIKEFSV